MLHGLLGMEWSRDPVHEPSWEAAGLDFEAAVIDFEAAGPR